MQCTCLFPKSVQPVITTKCEVNGDKVITIENFVCTGTPVERILTRVEHSDGTYHREALFVNPAIFTAEELSMLFEMGVLPLIWWRDRKPGCVEYSYVCTIINGQRTAYRALK
jgi:hypothetical protein